MVNLDLEFSGELSAGYRHSDICFKQTLLGCTLDNYFYRATLELVLRDVGRKGTLTQGMNIHSKLGRSKLSATLNNFFESQKSF